MRCFLIAIILLFAFSCNKNTHFSSEIWKKSGGENLTLDTRNRMVKDLIESQILLGKTEQNIINLIGAPSKVNRPEADSIKYYQVQEIYSWNIDPDELLFLKITFNECQISKKVEKFITK